MSAPGGVEQEEKDALAGPKKLIIYSHEQDEEEEEKKLHWYLLLENTFFQGNIKAAFIYIYIYFQLQDYIRFKFTIFGLYDGFKEWSNQTQTYFLIPYFNLLEKQDMT